MRVKAKSVNQNAEMTLPSKPSLIPIFKIIICGGLALETLYATNIAPMTQNFVQILIFYQDLDIVI